MHIQVIDISAVFVLHKYKVGIWSISIVYVTTTSQGNQSKSIFPNDESMQKMLYLATMDVLRRWTGRVQNWGQILLQLSVFFPDKVKSTLV